MTIPGGKLCRRFDVHDEWTGFATSLQALLAGLFAGLTAVALLPFRDVGGVGAMIRHDSGGWLALAMLAWGFGTTFGLAAAAGALADDKGKG